MQTVVPPVRRSPVPWWGRQAGFVLLALTLPVLGTFHVAPVRGASMEPTLANGQTVLYQALPKGWYSPKVGELVVFNAPTEPGHRYVKRIVGLPGDELRFSAGTLRVNGRLLALPQGAIEPGFRLSVRVPEESFFALGDHGRVSYDSRRFGSVPMRLLIGPLVG